VFQPLRLLVHLVQGVLQNVVKEQFEQLVMADEFSARRLPAAVIRPDARGHEAFRRCLILRPGKRVDKFGIHHTSS